MTEEYVRPTPEKHLPAFIVQSDGTCLLKWVQKLIYQLNRSMIGAFNDACLPKALYSALVLYF